MNSATEQGLGFRVVKFRARVWGFRDFSGFCFWKTCGAALKCLDSGH